MEEMRNPEEILRQIQKESCQKQNGKLKIFFGYAAGVGKTYSMLEAAHEMKKAGTDVVVGYIEPHTRPDTIKLLDGLTVIDPLTISHKGILLHEFDLDEAIKRKPELILVDELAHTNAEECRHVKRYQDIEELLKAGIDVYTTVNVQHIESLNDIVASITGVAVRERIPDHIFDGADQVELVDIEPEELIERMNQGKIYRQTQAQTALNHFFNLDNLIALREIALRRSADRVNKISEKKRSSSSTYYSGEHILICLSSSMTNAKVIRTASRMADAFKAKFTALFVETPNFSSMSAENKDRLRQNLKLAEQLGATVASVYGEDIAQQIAEFAHLSGVSKIVLGRTYTKKHMFFSKPSFSDRLTTLAPNLDIYIIPDNANTDYKAPKLKWSATYSFSVKNTVKSIIILIASTLIGLQFQHMGFNEANIITVYILGVLLISLVTPHKYYSIFSSIASVLIFNFLFVEPLYSFTSYGPGYPITYMIMFCAAFITGTLTMRIKQQATLAAQSAHQTKILLETSQMIGQAENPEDIMKKTAEQLIKLTNKTIVCYLAEGEHLLSPKVYSHGDIKEDITQYISTNEEAVAEWVFKNNTHAGATTNTLHGAKCLYLAVRGKEGPRAVVGIALTHDTLATNVNSLILSILNESALALEKDTLHHMKEQAAMQAQHEKLRANLLRSISHDLRTPLTSISGNAGVLLSHGEEMSEITKHQLYSDIYDDSMWLINLVENLLAVTRIEDGKMSLHLEPELMDEIISEALRHIDRRKSEHIITTHIADEILMANMDSGLMMQVIINLVDNAIKYTPEGSHIDIAAYKEQDKIIVKVTDDGPGIPSSSKSHLFEMFYTSNTSSIADSRRGMGLGLNLCQSIIHAHNGDIMVKDNTPHGSIFQFWLQAKEVGKV